VPAPNALELIAVCQLLIAPPVTCVTDLLRGALVLFRRVNMGLPSAAHHWSERYFQV
jgi:hypothetical protein